MPTATTTIAYLLDKPTNSSFPELVLTNPNFVNWLAVSSGLSDEIIVRIVFFIACSFRLLPGGPGNDAVLQQWKQRIIVLRWMNLIFFRKILKKNDFNCHSKPRIIFNFNELWWNNLHSKCVKQSNSAGKNSCRQEHCESIYCLLWTERFFDETASFWRQTLWI